MATDLKEIKNQTLRLLARREHSRRELQQKLLQKKYDLELINQVLQQVADDGWQNDIRFAEAFINMRKRQGYGPVRIQIELQQRGINDELAAKFINIDEEEWEELIKEVHRKKYRLQLPKDPVMLSKQVRFLQQRGFTIAQIKKLQKQLAR